MTSEYRFLLKTTQQLATLDSLGLSLADAESFHADEFGAEHITGIARWRQIRADAPAVLISSSGHFKAFKGDALVSRVEQPSGYTPQRIKGDPFALVGGSTRSSPSTRPGAPCACRCWNTPPKVGWYA
ncbi:MAG: hypothetical protein U0703_04715 [Anaerolineae bacterium]